MYSVKSQPKMFKTLYCALEKVHCGKKPNADPDSRGLPMDTVGEKEIQKMGR